MAYFLQQLINGLTLGSIYGLIAIGYTMVYGIIGMINFAHGEIYMIGAFIAMISFTILGVAGVTWVPLALLIVLVVTPCCLPPHMAGPWSVLPTVRCVVRSAWRRLISAIGMSLGVAKLCVVEPGRGREGDAAADNRWLYHVMRDRRICGHAQLRPDHNCDPDRGADGRVSRP